MKRCEDLREDPRGGDRATEQLSRTLPDKPRLDAELCLACGVCAVACPQSATTMTSRRSSGRIAVAPEISDACVACGICVAVCPANALILER